MFPMTVVFTTTIWKKSNSTMFRRILTLGVPCLAAAGIVAIAANALAEDDKVFTGSMCSFAEPGHYNGQDRSYVKLLNLSGQTETVSCPLKRDKADQPILKVYIIASAEVDEDSCKLWAREDDFSFESWSHDSVASTAPGYNKTNFGSGVELIFEPGDFASLQITCDLPDDASIVSYYLAEDN